MSTSPIRNQQISSPLPDWKKYMFCVLGIVISVVLPILRRMLPKIVEKSSVVFWGTAAPFLITGAFSLLAGVLVVAFAGDNVKTWTWQACVIAGYAWDSTLQKIVQP
jgi:hypothetical protein